MCYFVIISWVFIPFFALLLLYYYFYWCIKCIYVSQPWVTPLLSWARSTLTELSGHLVLWQTKKEQKHWVTKCHLEVFLNVVFYNSFSLLCLFFFFCYCLFLLSDTLSALVSECKTLSVRNPHTVSDNIPRGCTGLQIAWQAVPPYAASHTGISTLTYLWYLCVCCQLCWRICQTCYFTLYVTVLSDQEHMTTKRESPTVNHDVLCSIYMLLLERELSSMWVYSKVTNCSLVCMWTFVIEM